ncbi:Putative short-chain type dehydrogenase/reductase [Mycobacterium simulans]|uniref:SDR family NAD(P)-dependent oxidoreductase n=1 Tax=Mycobacterium simulans TaxID=627089 RepID=UPI00174D3A12|nr:SDR family NAD(P)-dependent oxidoreductase [Mycobacterium simulans]SON61156.1 Putative short-chain type dehydrogenase/reductase [Mycobacterium simulans]
MIDFTNQVALVTGAGRGLGRWYARELARRGAAVAGGVAAPSHESVASPEAVEAIVRLAVECFGRVDAVVSNAGIFNSIAFDELTADDWRKMLSVHLHGGFYLSQPAYRVMKKQSYGRFVFVSSSSGMFGQPMEAHYAAAKAGLVGLSNVIAIEGAQHGILANTMLPFGFSRMVTETLVVPDPSYSEDIVAHLSEVSATEPFTVPGSIFEEVFGVCARVQREDG